MAGSKRKPSSLMNRVSSDPQIVEYCKYVTEKLENAVSLKAADLQEQTDTAIRALVRLRDHVIDNMRSEQDSDGKREYKEFLDQVNIAISYSAAVEYPLTGIHRKMIQQADETLKKWTG